MLGGNVFVLEVGGFFEGLLQQLIGGIRDRCLGGFSGNFRQLLNLAIQIAEDRLRTYADFFQHRRDNPFFIFQQSREQMQRHQFRIAMFGCEIVRPLNGFLRFYSKFVPTDGHGKLHLVIW